MPERAKDLAKEAFVQSLANTVIVNKLNKDHQDWMQEEQKARGEGRVLEADELISELIKDVHQFQDKEGVFDEEEFIIGTIETKKKKK